MKRIILIGLLVFLCFPLISNASTASIHFTHSQTYGNWKKTVGSKPEDPLYVSFLRNYGQPDTQGTFFDSAKIAVLEPPKEYSTYEDLLDFMSPKAFSGDKKKLRLENDPLTYSEVTLGGAKGKMIRGTARLIYLDNSYPVTNMLAKGYYFDTKVGILEILVQIRSVKGDIEKIEQDVDELVNSFRFGLLEDMGVIRFLKEYKPSSQPVEIPQNKPVFPLVYLVYGGIGIIIISSMLAIIFLKRKRDSKKPLDPVPLKPIGKKKKS